MLAAMARVEGYAALARERMVGQLRQRGTSERTLAAFAAVPRHVLVPRFWLDAPEPAEADGVDGLDVLYSLDRAVAVNRVPDAAGSTTSTASAPGLLAAQADRLDVHPGMAVLEIGTGPGYFAAILAELVGPAGRVVSIDIDADIAAGAAERLAACGYRNVTVVVADGDLGAPDHAPFDRVVASVGCADVAPAWLSGLGGDGRALIPLLHGAAHPMVELGRRGEGRVALRSGYVAIQGRQASSDLWPHAGSGGEVTEAAPLPEDLRDRLAVEVGREALFGIREWDLAFWVAISDQRAGFLASLLDGGGSLARIDAAKGVLRWGGPDGRALADDLLGHARAGLAVDTPPIESFRHRFLRCGEGSGRWVVRRLHHDQVVST